MLIYVKKLNSAVPKYIYFNLEYPRIKEKGNAEQCLLLSWVKHEVVPVLKFN